MLEEEDNSQAIEEIQKTLVLVPDSPFLEFSLGRLYLKTSNSTEALQHTQKAIDLDPKFQEAYSLLAEIYISHAKMGRGY